MTVISLRDFKKNTSYKNNLEIATVSEITQKNTVDKVRQGQIDDWANNFELSVKKRSNIELTEKIHSLDITKDI